MKLLFSNRKERIEAIKKFLPDHELSFIDFQLANFKDFDLAVPMSPRDFLFLFDRPSEVKDNFLIPIKSTYQLCEDKLLFLKKCQELGYCSYFPNPHQHTKFPYILKKRIGSFGKDSYLITSKKDESDLEDKLDDDLYFKQEYVPGEHEYASHILFYQNKIRFLKTIQHNFSSSTYIKSKTISPISRELVDHEELKPLFQTILEHINFEGIACFDYKIGKDGNPKIFELNPRYGASLTRFLPLLIEEYDKVITEKQNSLTSAL